MLTPEKIENIIKNSNDYCTNCSNRDSRNFTIDEWAEALYCPICGERIEKRI